MSRAGKSLLMAALAAALVGAGPPARERSPGPPGHEPAEEAVWVTTDRGAVRGCALVAAPPGRGDDGLDALRREAVRLGADVLLLRSLSEGRIDADLYRCSASPAAPPAPAAPAAAATPRDAPSPVPALPVPRAAAAPLPASTPAPPAAASESASASPATERQRRARAELEGLKAALRVVEDPALVASCEKRGEGRGDEDTLRGDAVTANANVLLRVRPADSAVTAVTAEYFRCVEPFRTLRATPRPAGRTPTPRPGG